MERYTVLTMKSTSPYWRGVEKNWGYFVLFFEKNKMVKGKRGRSSVNVIKNVDIKKVQVSWEDHKEGFFQNCLV